MTGPNYTAAPVRCLIGVVVVWVIGRGALLVDWPQPSPPPGHANAEAIASLAPISATPAPRPMLIAGSGARRRPPVRLAAVSLRRRSPASPAPGKLDVAATAQPLPSAGFEPMPEGFRLISLVLPASAPLPAFPLAPPPSSASRLSGSAWLFLHGGALRSLAPSGELGGSQAGARLLYRRDRAGQLSASARLSRSLAGPPQSEAALGLDWRPLRRLPVHITVERRIALDPGGRNAWTIGVDGGAYAVPLTRGVRLDAYGEAGVVGLRERDLYADGGARITRTIGLGAAATLGLGAGAWGAAQPNVSRLELGPSLVLRAPVERAGLVLALDWRLRVAGSARPGSGPALTLGMDF